MYKLFDRVEYTKTKESCFVIDIDDDGYGDVIYGLEVEDQDKIDGWFYWANPEEIRKLPEHNFD